MSHITCPHLHKVLDREATDDLVRRCLQEIGYLNFDAFAFCGMSGALIAPLLAHFLKKELIMVRQQGVRCHSEYTTEGFASARRYILADDLISSGDTAIHILREVGKFSPRAKCIGFLLYGSGDLFHPPGSLRFDRVIRDFLSFYGAEAKMILAAMEAHFTRSTA